MRVHKVCFFRFGNPAGYVLHDQPPRAWQQVPISLGPFFLNTAIGFLLGLLVVLMKASLSMPQLYLLGWLGISIAMHSFPSTGDAKSLWKAAWGKGTPVWLKLIAIPLAGIIFLFALGSVFWLDLIYGIIITFILPGIVLGVI